MPLLLLIVGIGLFLAVNASSKQHRQEWLDQQPLDVGHSMYPGHFDLGEIIGCIVLAIMLLVLVATVSGGIQ